MNAIARAGLDAVSVLRQKPALLLVPASIAVGVLLVMPVPEKVILGIFVAAPLLMVQVAIIRNLFLGVILFLIMEYLQPGHRLPALGEVRLTFLISGSLLLAWILNLARHRVPISLNWQIKSYLLFGIMGIFSTYNAISIGMAGLVLFQIAKTLIVFTVMFSVVRSIERLERLVWLYVILHIILAVIGFGIFATTGKRQFGDVGGGFLGDENDSAMALLIMVPYMYFLLPRAKRTLLRLVLLGGMILSSITVLFSFSRGAFVGFLAMVLYMWGKSSHKLKVGLALLAGVLILFAIMPREYWKRIESTKDYTWEGSAQGRIDAWKGGLKMLRDSPIFGCGIGNFSRTYGTRYNTINTRWTAAHSMYVEFIGQLGIPGILFLVGTIVITLRTFARVRRAARRRAEEEFRSLEGIMLGAECGFVTYLVTTFFLSSLAYPHLWHFGAMAGFGALAQKRLDAELGPPLGAVHGSPEWT